MPADLPFGELVRAVRAGDVEAAAELVRLYEPEVRRVVRVRLVDPNLRRFVDSADICQSVLAAFFVRTAAGQFDLDEPDQLVRLLVTMARNKVFDHARKAAARPARTAGSDVWAAVPGADETPSEVVAGAELLAEARRRMTPAERDLVDRRAAGAGWQEVGQALGVAPDVVRKRYERTLDRVCSELGLGRGGHA